MVSAGDFRNGITVEMEGNVYQIIEFQHVKPGKGAAFCQDEAEKYHQRRRSGKELPADREIPSGTH